jgi:DNA gyrase/topoisomerase IV subunit A
VFVSAQGMIVRVRASTISRIGRATQCGKLGNLKQGNRLIAAARVVESDEGTEEIPEV